MTTNINLSKTLERIRNKVMSGAYDKDIDSFRKEEEKKEIGLERLAIKTMLNVSGLPNYFIDREITLNSIIPENDDQKKIIRQISSWDASKNFRLPYLYGKTGSGKSYISMAFASHVIIKNKIQSYFLSLSQYLSEFKRKDDSEIKISPYTVNILILDDFGAHNVTRNTIELLHSLIEYRLRNRKPTFITSNIRVNKAGEELHKLAKNYNVSNRLCNAIEDRFFDLCTILKLNCNSIRVKNAIKRVKNTKTKT